MKAPMQSFVRLIHPVEPFLRLTESTEFLRKKGKVYNSFMSLCQCHFMLNIYFIKSRVGVELDTTQPWSITTHWQSGILGNVVCEKCHLHYAVIGTFILFYMIRQSENIWRHKAHVRDDRISTEHQSCDQVKKSNNIYTNTDSECKQDLRFPDFNKL